MICAVFIFCPRRHEEFFSFATMKIFFLFLPVIPPLSNNCANSVQCESPRTAELNFQGLSDSHHIFIEACEAVTGTRYHSEGTTKTQMGQSLKDRRGHAIVAENIRSIFLKTGKFQNLSALIRSIPVNPSTLIVDDVGVNTNSN